MAGARGRTRAGSATGSQDTNPCEPDQPLPVAERTGRFPGSCGA
jgi:hypothetical protein